MARTVVTRLELDVKGYVVPLNAAEKSDIVRAVVGYALAEDSHYGAGAKAFEESLKNSLGDQFTFRHFPSRRALLDT